MYETKGEKGIYVFETQSMWEREREREREQIMYNLLNKKRRYLIKSDKIYVYPRSIKTYFVSTV